jgi:hypothetical protein
MHAYINFTQANAHCIQQQQMMLLQFEYVLRLAVGRLK